MSEGSQLVINFTETLTRIVDSCRRTEVVRAIVFCVEIPAIEMPHNRRLVINQTSCHCLTDLITLGGQILLWWTAFCTIQQFLHCWNYLHSQLMMKRLRCNVVTMHLKRWPGGWAFVSEESYNGHRMLCIILCVSSLSVNIFLISCRWCHSSQMSVQPKNIEGSSSICFSQILSIFCRRLETEG